MMGPIASRQRCQNCKHWNTQLMPDGKRPGIGEPKDYRQCVRPRMHKSATKDFTHFNSWCQDWSEKHEG